MRASCASVMAIPRYGEMALIVVASVRLFFPMLFVLCLTITISVTGTITHHR